MSTKYHDIATAEFSADGKSVKNPDTGRWVYVTTKKARKLYGPTISYLGEEKSVCELLPHQIEVKDYFLRSTQPGILLDWDLGVGKTKGAAECMDAILDNGPQKKAFIFTPASLRVNFIGQYTNMCGGRHLDKLTFVTTNYTGIEKTLPSAEQLSDSVIVIDEWHQIINGVRNGSKIYTIIYERLLACTGCRFIGMSGSPITKDELDIWYMCKLFGPNLFESKEAFQIEFEDRITNDQPDDFDWKLSQVISRVTANHDPSAFPQVKEIHRAVYIHGKQYDNYLLARSSEMEIIPPNKKIEFTNPEKYAKDKARFYLAYSMLKSRQATNMYYPPEYPDDESLDNDYIQQLEEYAPKFHIILSLLPQLEGKHVIFSEFKTMYGINAMAEILNMLNIPFLEFTGDMNDEDRADTIEKFNAETNLEGEEYRILLVTKAGALGQNFLECRALHILEQNIDEILIAQVKGRVNRFNSHARLPPNKRNLRIIRYFGVTAPPPPPSNTVEGVREYRQFIADHPTSDSFAYQIGMKKMVIIKKAMAILDTLHATPQ